MKEAGGGEGRKKKKRKERRREEGRKEGKKEKERKEKERGRKAYRVPYLCETLGIADWSRMTAGQAAVLGSVGTGIRIGRGEPRRPERDPGGDGYVHDPDRVDGFMGPKLPQLYTSNTGVCYTPITPP